MLQTYQPDKGALCAELAEFCPCFGCMLACHCWGRPFVAIQLNQLSLSSQRRRQTTFSPASAPAPAQIQTKVRTLIPRPKTTSTQSLGVWVWAQVSGWVRCFMIQRDALQKAGLPHTPNATFGCCSCWLLGRLDALSPQRHLHEAGALCEALANNSPVQKHLEAETRIHLHTPWSIIIHLILFSSLFASSAKYIYIYIYMPKASFSAYVLVKILLKTGEKSALFDQKMRDQFWSSFLFLPFSLFCPKMAKICCFCLAKSQKRRQKTRPPPYIYIYIYIYRFLQVGQQHESAPVMECHD